MDWKQAMEARHSVRQYTDRPLEGETLEALLACIDTCNAEGGLHLQLVQNEPKAFQTKNSHFSGVNHYIAVAGKKGGDFEERCGYYGEKVVLTAQTLGLNTCWVALSYKRVPGVVQLRQGERIEAVISVGYGATQGEAHKSKSVAQVSNADAATPQWFLDGGEAALLAPTAVNQQKFFFAYQNGKVIARPGLGFYTRLDLGIAKLHFELGAEKDGSIWA